MSEHYRDPRTGEIYNSSRADRAQAALDAYIDFTGDSPDESHFRDLLSDLRHLAARDGAGDKLDRTAAAVNDDTGHCIQCGRDNNGHEGEPCSDDCPMYSLTFDEANEMAGRCFADEVYIEANADDIPEVDIADVVGVPGGLRHG